MYLIDTHILLWATKSPKKLKAETRNILENFSDIYVSVLSVFELIHKMQIGKLELNTLPETLVTRSDFKFLPLQTDHVTACRKLPLHHRDPFDRLLISQAGTEGFTLITSDKMIWKYERHVKILKD